MKLNSRENTLPFKINEPSGGEKYSRCSIKSQMDTVGLNVHLGSEAKD